MNPIGIMQGRLSPSPAGRAQAFPFETWPQEFAHAAKAGFDSIEWLMTAEQQSENPLLVDHDVTAVSALIAESGVRVTTLCADFLIPQPLLRVAEGDRSASMVRLAEVVTRSRNVGVEVIVVPILENGEIRNDEEAGLIADLLRPMARLADAHGQRLAIESQLPIADVCGLIDRCGSPAIGVCYDLGNAAATGADCADDIRRMGKSLFEVHIKDRVRNGASVALGSGAVNFTDAFQALADVHYNGPLILETPAGADPLANAHRHLAFVQQHLRSVALTPR